MLKAVHVIEEDGMADCPVSVLYMCMCVEEQVSIRNLTVHKMLAGKHKHKNCRKMFEIILFSEISGCPADPLLFVSGGPSENRSAAGHRATAYLEPCVWTHVNSSKTSMA